MEEGKRMFSTDAELVEALKSGDKRAIRQVYERCYASFAAYVSTCGGSEEDAEDCFQEGILSAWVNVCQGRYQLQSNAAFTTYVLGVCKYKWMNKMRSSNYKNVSFPDELPDLVAVPADETYEEHLQLLSKGLSSLGSLCQDILKMFYFEKLSYEEIERRTGKTADSLKNQKYRCVNKLREIVTQLKAGEE